MAISSQIKALYISFTSTVECPSLAPRSRLRFTSDRAALSSDGNRIQERPRQVDPHPDIAARILRLGTSALPRATHAITNRASGYWLGTFVPSAPSTRGALRPIGVALGAWSVVERVTVGLTLWEPFRKVCPAVADTPCRDSGPRADLLCPNPGVVFARLHFHVVAIRFSKTHRIDSATAVRSSATRGALTPAPYAVSRPRGLRPCYCPCVPASPGTVVRS